MKVGFTGTRYGMSFEQNKRVYELLAFWFDELREIYREEKLEEHLEFHHGDCKGSDMEFHGLIRKNNESCKIVIHPPRPSNWRANCHIDSKNCELRPEKGNLERNHDIVDECDIMIATPGTMEEVMRSGTWATVRYARKLGKAIVLMLPSGVQTLENIESLNL